MDDINEQPERRVNTITAINALAHKIDLWMQSQNTCNAELLKGISDLRAISDKHAKTLYGNGDKGLCEQARLNAANIAEVEAEAAAAKAKIWGLIIAVIGFIVIEVIKVI